MDSEWRCASWWKWWCCIATLVFQRVPKTIQGDPPYIFAKAKYDFVLFCKKIIRVGEIHVWGQFRFVQDMGGTVGNFRDCKESVLSLVFRREMIDSVYKSPTYWISIIYIGYFSQMTKILLLESWCLSMFQTCRVYCKDWSSPNASGFHMVDGEDFTLGLFEVISHFWRLGDVAKHPIDRKAPPPRKYLRKISHRYFPPEI